jgi:hypothetical protein
MIITADTALPGTAADTLLIPLVGTDVQVDWGDGIISYPAGGTVSHTYAAGGVKTVKISSVSNAFAGLKYGASDDDSNDRKKITSVLQWGSAPWPDMQHAFRSCFNLTNLTSAGDAPNLSLVTDMTNGFRFCLAFTTFPQNWALSGVQTFVSTWEGCQFMTSGFDSYDLTGAVTLERSWYQYTDRTGLMSWNCATSTNLLSIRETWYKCDLSNCIADIDIINQSLYIWVLSASGTNEWYLARRDGLSTVGLTFDIADLLENSLSMPVGSIGALAAGERVTGNNDSLPSNTIYVRLSDGADPNGKAAGYITLQDTAVFPYFEMSAVTDGAAPWVITNLRNMHPDLDFSSVTDTQGTWFGAGFMGLNGELFPVYDYSSVQNALSMFDSAANIILTGPLDLRSMTVGTDFFTSAGTISPEHLAETYEIIAVHNPNDNVSFNMSTSNSYCDWAETYKDQMLARGWTFTDNGAVACTSDELIFVVDTEETGISNSDQFLLPLIAGGTYDFDYKFATIEGSHNTDSDLTLTAPSAGGRVLRIDGSSFSGVYFNNANDDRKLLEVNNWGTLAWDSFECSFEGCLNMQITAGDLPDLSLVTNMRRAFYDCRSMTSFPLMDVSNVTDFQEAWRNCVVLLSFPALNMIQATTVGSTWYGCTNMTTFGAVTLNPALPALTSAWNSCSSLTSFPELNIANVSNFESSWKDCNSLVTFPGENGNWTFASATDLGSTWWGCSSLVSFPELNIANATNLYSTWRLCSGLTTFPAENGNLNFASATTVFYAWNSCSSLSSFPMTNFASLTNASGSWLGCSGLTTFPSLVLGAGKVVNFNNSWQSCSGLTTFSAQDFKSSTQFQNAWNGCSSLVVMPTHTWTPINLREAFRNCTSMTTLPATLDTSNLTNVMLTCYNMSSLEGVPNWDFSNITNFDRTFQNCGTLSYMRIYDFGAMTNGSNMFSGTTIPTLDYSAMLVQTENSNSESNVNFHGGSSKYNSQGRTAKDALIADHTWTITDDGIEAPDTFATLVDGSGNVLKDVVTGQALWVKLLSIADVDSIGWWDGSDIPTITEASGLVSQLDDKSGVAPDLTQSPGFEPMTGTHMQNDLNMLYFDGSEALATYNSDFVIPANGNFSVTQVTEVFLPLDNVADGMFSMLDVGGTDWQFVGGVNVNNWNGRAVVTELGGVNTNFAPMGVGPSVYTLEFNFDAGTISAYVGGQYVGGTTYTIKPTSPQQFIVMSNRVGQALAGHFGENYILSDITEGTRQIAEGITHHKWGIQNQLLASHPYKYSPPTE